MHTYNATKIASLISQDLATPATSRPECPPQAVAVMTTGPVTIVVPQRHKAKATGLATPRANGVYTQPNRARPKTAKAKAAPDPRLVLDFPVAAPEKKFSLGLAPLSLAPPVDDNKVDAANWLRDKLPLVASSDHYVGTESSAEYLAGSLDARTVRGLRAMVDSGGLSNAITDALWYKGIEQRPDRPLKRIVTAALRRYDVLAFSSASRL